MYYVYGSQGEGAWDVSRGDEEEVKKCEMKRRDEKQEDILGCNLE